MSITYYIDETSLRSELLGQIKSLRKLEYYSVQGTYSTLPTTDLVRLLEDSVGAIEDYQIRKKTVSSLQFRVEHILNNEITMKRKRNQALKKEKSRLHKENLLHGSRTFAGKPLVTYPIVNSFGRTIPVPELIQQVRSKKYEAPLKDLSSLLDGNTLVQLKDGQLDDFWTSLKNTPVNKRTPNRSETQPASSSTTPFSPLEPESKHPVPETTSPNSSPLLHHERRYSIVSRSGDDQLFDNDQDPSSDDESTSFFVEASGETSEPADDVADYTVYQEHAIGLPASYEEQYVNHEAIERVYTGPSGHPAMIRIDPAADDPIDSGDFSGFTFSSNATENAIQDLFSSGKLTIL